VGLDFNVKPAQAVIDSFRINSGGFTNLSGGDTIVLMARSDTLSFLGSAMDFDSASFVEYRIDGFAGVAGSLSLASGYTYTVASQISPIDTFMGVYDLKFSVTDSNGWGSDTFSAFVELQNDTPAVSVSDSVFLFQSAVSGGALADGDTVRFMRRHYAVFYGTVQDLNDSGFTDLFLLVDGSPYDSQLSVAAFTDTVDISDLPDDTTTYSFVVSDPGLGTDTLSLVVIALNDPPQAVLTDTTFLFGSALLGGSVVDGDTVRFMKRHFAVIYGTLPDQNDSGSVDVSITLDGVPHGSGTAVYSFTDTVDMNDLPTDTGQYQIIALDPDSAADTVVLTMIAYNDAVRDSVAFTKYTGPGVVSGPPGQIQDDG